MLSNRVVCRYRDGRISKGTTRDFLASKPVFHLHPEGDEKQPALTISTSELKGVFFVKSFEGNSRHFEHISFDDANGQGKKVFVTFHDDEVLAGFSTGVDLTKPGFFLFPVDAEGNNERIFVISSAVRAVRTV
jgi:hypothetical protein